MTADLDRVVAQADCVLFDFDGPICAVFAGYPAPKVAAALRTHLPAPIPADIETTDDPLQILTHALTLGDPIATQVEAAMTATEDQAIHTATATPSAADAIRAARQSGRRVGFVSNNSAHVLAGYLTDHGLIGRGDVISARAPGTADRMKPHPYFIVRAIHVLDVNPERTVLVGDSTTDIAAAHAAGTRAIGYANKPGKEARLTDAGADAIITDMHDLARALDTHPTPTVT